MARPKDFLFRDGPEPHATRKVEILKKYPEMKALMVHEPLTKYIVAATVALQVSLAVISLNWSWSWYLAVIYVVGATANHSLFLAIHELAHNLGFKSSVLNKLCAMLANLPIGIPYCITFKPYHMEHHRYQGMDGVDTDIPTSWEGYLITSTALGSWDHMLRKALFMLCQIFAYAFRPMLVKPSSVPKDGWIVLNWVVQFGFDIVMMYLFGWKIMLYFLLSTFFAGSIHPTAGHFIAEHYVMEGKVETYSYYGPLNALAYNVGYHNEVRLVAVLACLGRALTAFRQHHDFPNIPWSNLPKVRQIAPEFYDNLPQCNSWPGTILRYILDDSISPYSRVKQRPSGENEKSK